MKKYLSYLTCLLLCGYLYSDTEVTKQRIGSLSPDDKVVMDVDFSRVNSDTSRLDAKIDSLSNHTDRVTQSISDNLDDETSRLDSKIDSLSNHTEQVIQDITGRVDGDTTGLSSKIDVLSNHTEQVSQDLSNQITVNSNRVTDLVSDIDSDIENIRGIITTGTVHRANKLGTDDFYMDRTGIVWKVEESFSYELWDKNNDIKYPLDHYEKNLFYTEEFEIDDVIYYYMVTYNPVNNKWNLSYVKDYMEDEPEFEYDSEAIPYIESLDLNVSFPETNFVFYISDSTLNTNVYGQVIAFSDKTVIETQNGIFYVKSASNGSIINQGNNIESQNSYAFGLNLKISRGSNNSLASGSNNCISNLDAQAFGRQTKATGIAAHAEGWGTIASGEEAHAEGYFTEATNFNGHAEGYRTKAYGQHTHAEGWYTEAHGFHSHAEGDHSIAVGDVSHAAGRYAKATHNSSFVWQGLNNGNYYESIADGTFCINPSGGIRGTYIGKKHIRQHIIDVIDESDLSETISNLNITIQNQQNQINQLLDIISTLSNKLETTITNFDNGRIMIDSETKSVYKREYGYVIRIDPEQLIPHMKMAATSEEDDPGYLNADFIYHNTIIGDHKTYYYLINGYDEFKLELEIFTDNKIIFRLHHQPTGNLIFEKPGNIMSDSTWTDKIEFEVDGFGFFRFTNLNPYRPVDVIIGKIQPQE